jgi:hypothetical protein
MHRQAARRPWKCSPISGAAIAKGLQSERKFALYGLQFATESADLRPDSDATLEQMSDLIKNGKTEKLDIPAEGGPMISFARELGDDIKRSTRDLGMQTVNGQAVHVYSFTSGGLPTTF